MKIEGDVVIRLLCCNKKKKGNDNVVAIGFFVTL
jgi:hypothetical protein